MTETEALQAIARLHEQWSGRYGDVVPYVEGDESPHDGQETDLAIWNADRSAPANIDDKLNTAISAILDQVQQSEG